jgi:hypothetical protein
MRIAIHVLGDGENLSVSCGSSDMQDAVTYMCLEKFDVKMNMLIQINYMKHSGILFCHYVCFLINLPVVTSMTIR